MDADNLEEIGHRGFTIDAEAMTALLVDFAMHADYRAAVKKEFEGIKALFGSATSHPATSCRMRSAAQNRRAPAHTRG